MGSSGIFASFIVPAYNEEKNISKLIGSIKEHTCNFTYEIIVVNHQSKDRTAIIANQMGCRVIDHAGGSIASVRNHGARVAEGEVLVFLDADVELTASWFDRISYVFDSLSRNSKQLYGSHCLPSGHSFIERNWYAGFVSEIKTTHIGSAHMIINKTYFFELGGFNEKKITGEDYDLCKRITNNGGRLVNDEALKVYHSRNPNNISSFVSKQIWHGTSDWDSLGAVFCSKVSVATIIFLVLHLLQVAFFLLFGYEKAVVYIPTVMLLLFLLISSYIKFHHCGYKVVFINSLLFYLYYFGRALSLYYVIVKKIVSSS